jgi:hypothetical protein
MERGARDHSKARGVDEEQFFKFKQHNARRKRGESR